MNRPLSPAARRRAALAPAALFRDVAPDRETVTIYDDDGEVAVQCDLPVALMKAVREAARRFKKSPHEICTGVLLAALDRFERGF